MSNEEYNHNDDHGEDEEDEEYRLAFANICSNEDIIDGIRDNDPNITKFSLTRDHFHDLSNLACELLGRYIADNTHLKEFGLKENQITDDKLALLFRGLSKSSSIELIDLSHNDLGVNGIRSMLPFLKNTPNLGNIYLNGNDGICTEGFELVICALNGSSSMEELWFDECNIEDISALNTYTLPNLRILDLGHNDIGREGCIIIANLLQKEASTLKNLYLDSTDMGDEGAEILANSLKHNTKLELLDLELNNIGERGKGAFLKLLNDISSIESTYNSNHTLIELDLNLSGDVENMIC